MAHFLNMIHKRAENDAKLSVEEEEEFSKVIPEEKLREEDLVSLVPISANITQLQLYGYYCT